MSEAPTVPGLATPQLKGRELTSDTADENHEGDSSTNGKTSVFDIAQEVEEKLKGVLSLVEKHDKNVQDRIDALVKRIAKLENSVNSRG